MPILIAKLGAHRNDDAVIRLAHYMAPNSRTYANGGAGVIAQSTETVIESFEVVKKYYEKNENGQKHISHFVIGSKKEGIIVEELYAVAMTASNYFYSRGFQNYFAIHRGSNMSPDYLHIHLAVNTINFRDGKRLYEVYSNTSELCHVLEDAFPYWRWFSVNDSKGEYDNEFFK